MMSTSPVPGVSRLANGQPASHDPRARVFPPVPFRPMPDCMSFRVDVYPFAQLTLTIKMKQGHCRKPSHVCRRYALTYPLLMKHGARVYGPAERAGCGNVHAFAVRAVCRARQSPGEYAGLDWRGVHMLAWPLDSSVFVGDEGGLLGVGGNTNGRTHGRSGEGFLFMLVPAEWLSLRLRSR